MSFQQSQPYRNPRIPQARCKTIDVHGLLNNEIYSQGNAQPSAFDELNSYSGAPPPPQQAEVVGFRDDEFYFDSVYRDLTSNLTSGELKYSIPAINNNNDISNIIEMKIDSFWFPRVLIDPALPDIFYYRRVFLTIATLPVTQSVLGARGHRYHFEFEVTNPTGTAVLLVPIKDTYYFQQPIISLSDVIFNFTLPHNYLRIPLPNDRLLVQSVPATNPAQFVVLSPEGTAPIGPIGVPAAPGVAVYPRDFATTNPGVDAIINNPTGQFVTNIVSATVFEIAAFDFTSAAFTPYDTNPQVGVIIIPKNRIAIDLRFTSVKKQTTNYTIATHD